jgi:exodeoxyribonuclease VII small subunit
MAQRFNGWLFGQKRQPVPAGMAEISFRPYGTRSRANSFPSAKALGYCHFSASDQNPSFHLAAAVLNFAFGMSSKAKSPGAELNFEKAMSRLEAIVEQMESGKLPLEDLIVRYEEGMNLVKVCQERLTSAEQKIEIIARNNAGKPVVKDFEPVAESSNDVKGEEKELKNDEVRLF